MPELISSNNSNDAGNESLIANIARLLNRIIPVSDDIINDYESISELYLPISTKRCKNDIENVESLSNVSFESTVISSCFDGVLMAIMINMIEPDYIDLRAIHLPGMDENKDDMQNENENENENKGDEKENDGLNANGLALPLTDAKVKENIATVLSSIKALGMYLSIYNIYVVLICVLVSFDDISVFLK